MKTIEVAGIPFTNEILQELKRWIVPYNSYSEKEIDDDIETLNHVQSFIIHHRSVSTEESDKEILDILSGIDYLRRRLSIMNKIKIES